MAFLSDILKKIKKPVDALKNFLTPKERTSLQEKEKLSPTQRIETKLPSFEYKPPSFEGLKSFASSLVPPKEVFKPVELAPRETPEERAVRLAKAHETTKKIAEFGKAVLRAGPRAAASVTLEAQGRRTMIPETKAEKFLFGQEPLESITERIERFPERAKEFGISEPVSKKIAPFAVLGLTALDILPPLPGKAGLKGVAKKALTTKTAKEFAKAITEKEAGQILKAGFKSVDDFFRVTKNPTAKASASIVNELKAAASAKPATPAISKELEPLVQETRKANLKVTQKGGEHFLTGTDFAGRSVKVRGTKEFVEQEMIRARGVSQAIPKELESFVPKAGKHKDVNSFIREISGDTYAPEFRNPIADFWRKKYVQPLSKGSRATFTTDVVAFERNLDDVLNTKYVKDQLANMSVRQKAEIVNGKKWTDLYADMLDNNLFKFQTDFFKAAKGASQARPTTALKEAAVQNVGKAEYIPPQDLVQKTVKYEGGYKTILEQKSTGKEIANIGSSPQAAKYWLKEGYGEKSIKEAVGKTIHAKKLESGIDEAYRALQKASKDDVYNLGKVGDYIADPKLREQYKDVLDTPLYVKKQMHMGKAHGSLSVDPKGNPAIVLSDGLTKDMVDRTLVEELTHAKQFQKGIRPTTGVPYKEIPEEIRAKQAAKHFAPKTTLDDLIEEAGLHRAKAKQFSNNDLEKEFVARQLGVAEGIEKAIENIKTARPTDELKKVLYHGTDFENVPKIQRGGFKVGGFLVHGYPQGVYFTTTKKEAQNYGKVIQSTTKLKLSEFFDVSKHKELNNLSGDKYVQKLNQIIREAAESKGIAVPEATAKQAKQYTELVGKQLKDPLDISDIKTATLQKLGYKGFIAAEKGIGKEIVVFDPKDVVAGGKPSEALKTAVPKVSKELQPLARELQKYDNIKDALPKEVRDSKIKDSFVFGSSVKGGKYKDIDVALFIDLNDPAYSKVATNPKIGQVLNRKVGKIEYHILPDTEKGRDIFQAMLEFKTETGKGIAVRTNFYKQVAISKPVEALKTAVTKLPDIPEIKGAKATDLSQPAKTTQPSKVQEIIGEYQKRINTTPAKKAATPIKKTLDDTYTAIIDRFHPITKLARKATDLRPGENPELLARRYLGIQGIAESKLFWNTTRLTAEGNLEVTGPGLSKILKPAKNNIDDLRTLMIAERDIELSKRTLESGKKVVGTTPEKSGQVINALKQKYGDGFAQLSKTAQGVREWSHKALLDPLLEVGAISKEQYETITKSNKFYVPFQRVIEELETHGFVPKKVDIFSPKSVPIKKLKGSAKDIIDPFESMITNAYKVTDFVERARVGRSIVNLRKTSPELAEMIKPISPKIVPVAKHGEELIFRPSFFTPDKNTMMVFENGKRKFYQVPEDVFKAVSGMMESDVGAIMKVLAFPARTLRAGATLTPEFMGRNPLRDQFTAFVFSKYGYVPGVDLIKGVFNTVGKTDLHGRWLAGGGAHSMFVSLDRMTSQATLAKVLGAKDIKGMVKNPIEALRMLSEFGEKGTRIGAFGRAVGKGVSDLEAAFESRDITLDFARRGSQTRAVNMLVAFWNAQVQGLNKLVRAFRERPMQTTFKAASGITLPSVLLYLNNRNDPRYQELPQWQKDLFWILPIGDKGPIIRIPKPFEVGVIFGTVPEHILTWIDKNDPEALTSAAKTFMEASAPGYIPTGLQPIIENVANYSFFRQRPIVSEGKQALPKELQAERYTSETAKEVGKLIKQSPAKIENLFVSYTGGLGKYALDASDKLLKTLGVISPPSGPAKTLADRPFIRAFVAREPIGSGSESVNKFYKFYDEANATKAAVKGLAEEGKETEAVNYLRSHPAGFYTKGLNKVARTFSDLRKKRDAVLDSRDLNPEQKKRAIDALDKIMTEIARQTVELVGSSNEKFRQ